MKGHTRVESKGLLTRVKEMDIYLTVLKIVPVFDASHMPYTSEIEYQVQGGYRKAYSLTLTRQRRLVGSERKTALKAFVHEVFLGRTGLGKGVHRQ